MTNSAPLWAMCTLNDDTLPESTPAIFGFEYVDISNVTEGQIGDEIETVTFGQAPSRARRRANDGDIIISTVRTYLRAIAQVHTTENERVFSTGFAVLRPCSSTVEPRYLAYALGSAQVMDEIVAASVGVSYPAIQGSVLHRIRIPNHDRHTQHAISDFLDRETVEIDSMIGKMDELAATLRGRKAALASQLLVMNFDRVKLKWLVTEIDHRAGGLGNDLPLLSVSIHHGVQLREDSTSNQGASEDLSQYKVARAGEIVLNRMRAFQGGLGMASFDGLVSPDYSVVKPNDHLSPRWAEYVMRTPEFVAEMTQRLRGIGGVDQSNVRTPRINFRDLIELEIPLPSPDEQKRIADHLDEVTGKINAMLAKVAELKALLTERRAALITDVVTGRKDVA